MTPALTAARLQRRANLITASIVTPCGIALVGFIVFVGRYFHHAA